MCVGGGGNGWGGGVRLLASPHTMPFKLHRLRVGGVNGWWGGVVSEPLTPLSPFSSLNPKYESPYPISIIPLIHIPLIP